MMINLKVLSTAAVMALVLPIAMSSMSFAQGMGGNARGGHSAPGGGGGAGMVRGGGGGAGFVRGGGGAAMGGGGGMRVAPSMGMRPGGGGAAVAGGGYYRGDGGYHRYHGGGGFWPGAVVGGVIGGALASQSYGYYGPGYYDDQYYDDSAVTVDAAPGGDDAVAYCTQTYRSYDPQSGTYLGNDGYRHPCP
jgi:BA14K-like protein